MHKILYQSHTMGETNLVPGVLEHVLWPVKAHCVIAKKRKSSELNIFEKSVLRLCASTLCNLELLCSKIVMQPGVVMLILRRLRDKELLAGFQVTPDGKRYLEEEQQQTVQSCQYFIFQDCFSGNFFPYFTDKLNTISCKSDKEIKFRPEEARRQIVARPLTFPRKTLSRPEDKDVERVFSAMQRMCSNLLLLQEDHGSFDSLRLSKNNAELLYLYTNIGISGDHKTLRVQDPFFDRNCPMLEEDLQKEEALASLAGEIYQKGDIRDVNTSGAYVPLQELGDIEKYLRPLPNIGDEIDGGELTLQTAQRLAEFYAAVECACKRLFCKYDLNALINSLSRFDAEEIREALIKMTRKAGFLMSHHTKNSAQKSDSPQSDPQTAFLQKLFFDPRLFTFKGADLQNCLTGEATLAHWAALLLLVHSKTPLDAVKKLSMEFPDFLNFICWLAPYKKTADHGGNNANLPTPETMVQILEITRTIVSCILPNIDLNPEYLQQLSDRSVEENQRDFQNAEHQLSELIGFSRKSELPRAVVDKLIMICMGIARKDKEMIFQYAMVVDHVLFDLLDQVHIPWQNGFEIIKDVKQRYPSLENIFFEIKESKLTRTLQHQPTGLRANILCMLANTESQSFFTQQRLDYLKKMLNLRTHAWRELLAEKRYEEIEVIGKETINFVSDIMKEYDL